MLGDSNSTHSFNSSFSPVDMSGDLGIFWFVTAFASVNIFLLLPLYVFVLTVACQRWRQPGSPSTSIQSDVFTYHMVAMEMLQVLGCFCFCVGAIMGLPQIFVNSFQVMDTAWNVKLQFHMLTCVELYLAVVHPVTYLRFKDSVGVRIRNIGAGFAWLLLIVWGILSYLSDSVITMFLRLSLDGLVLILVSFCYISILWTLKRPGPGDRAKYRDRVNQSKQRASHIITVIMVVLWLSLGGALVCDVLLQSAVMNELDDIPKPWSLWFSVPGSLVLPVLYLQRAGKLPSSRDCISSTSFHRKWEIKN